MDHKQALSTYREEVNKLRWKLNQLEVNSIEQQASDQVHVWRQNFKNSSSRQVERVLNEIEKRKQSEVSRLTTELRTSLDQFKETNLARLARLDAFILRINADDEIQFDYVKFELDLITKSIESLQMDILVKVVDKSMRRRSSTALTRESLELVKVFELKRPGATTATTTTTTSSTNFLGPLKQFLRRASSAGASYYNTGLLT